MKRAVTKVQAIIVIVIIVVAVAAAAVYIEFGSSPSKANVSVTLPWLVAGYNAPFYAALDQGYYAQHGLNVSVAQGTGSGIAIKAVASGSFNFAEVDLPTAMVAMSQGLNIISVGAIDQVSGLSAIAVANRNNLTSPTSIEGLTWGYHPGGAGPVAFDTFLTVNNIPASSIKSNTSIGYPEEQFVMSGSVDFITEFLNYEAVNVMDAGYVPSTLPFFNWGVSDYGFGLITSTTFAKANPSVVSAFVAATIQGEIYTMQNPTQAIQIVQKYVPDANTTLLRDQLATTFAYKMWTSGDAATQGVWYQSAARWNSMSTVLKPILGTTNTNVSGMWTNQYLPASSSRQIPSSLGTITGANVPGKGYDQTVTASGIS